MSKIAITIDVETDWGGRLKPSRNNMKGIINGLSVLLELFNKNNINATFFISSETINNAKKELLEIGKYGHEIASHGHNHIDYSILSSAKYKKQILLSKNIIEDNLNQKVTGFRSPQFRTNKNHFEVLAETGIKYDSSIVPSFFPGRYNNKLSLNNPHLIGSILEIPVSTFTIFNLPMGLKYINIFDPHGTKYTNSQDRPIILYMHLFDILSNQNKNNDFNFIINKWYAYRSNKVLSTLNSFIKSNLSSGKNFVKMSNIYNNCIGST